MAARSFAYHARGTADGYKFCCYNINFSPGSVLTKMVLSEEKGPTLGRMLTVALLKCKSGLLAATGSFSCEWSEITITIRNWA